MILVDADACPVRAEVETVATRRRVPVRMVSNGGLRPSRNLLVTMVFVAEGADAADKWIAARAAPGDVVVTADIPLAARAVEAGARVLKPDGEALGPANIGNALATRDLMADLRAADPFRQGGGRAFTKADRSRFLSALDRALAQAERDRTMAADAVIFDIGNVLIEWHPERHYDRTIGEERRKRLFSEVDLHGMNDRIDRGADFRQTVYDTADAHPGWQDEIREWHDNWLALARPVIDHSVRLLQGLRAAGVPVFALTNFGVGSFALAEEHYGFLSDFDRRYVSGHMQVIKPEPDIYAMVEDDCGIAPDRLLFTDDRADNIAAARARGWQTHLFDGPRGWADRLVAEGLLTEDAAA